MNLQLHSFHFYFKSANTVLACSISLLEITDTYIVPKRTEGFHIFAFHFFWTLKTLFSDTSKYRFVQPKKWKLHHYIKQSTNN